MSVFETQVIEESLRVVLIGNYTPFLKKMEVVFSEFQLETWLLSEQEFKNIDTSSLDNKNIYKIVWWPDLNDEQSIYDVLAVLSKNKNSALMVVVPLPELFLPAIEKNEELLKQQALLTKITETLVNLQLFLIKDLFSQDYLPPVFKLALQNLDKKMLLNPGGESNLISLDQVIENLKIALLKPPQNNKIVFQGKNTKNINILEYFSKIFTRVFNQELEIVTVNATRNTNQITDLITVTLDSNEKEIVENIIEQKEEFKKQLTTLPRLENKQLKELIKTTTESSSEAEKPAVKPNNDEVITPPIIVENKYIEKKPIDQSKNNNSFKEEAIEGELSRLFKEKRTEKKEKRIDEKVKIVKKISNKSKKNKVLFVGGLGIMILGGVSLALWLVLELSISFAKKDFKQYLYQNTPQNYQAYQLGFWPGFLEGQTTFYEKVLGDIILEKTSIAGLFNDFKELQDLQEKLKQQTQQYVLGVVGVGETKEAFPQEITTLTDEIDSKIAKVEEAIFYLSSEEAEETTRWLNYLDNYKEDINKIKQYPDFFTDFFGGSGKKTYAVLLQNNLEVRPTGGFIQGFILLTFDKGLLIDSQIFNTNEVDTRLPGSVASPEEVQRYLGEKNWFIRDSNWDPDFPTTAKRVSWFIQEALKKQVDGVVAINYYVVQDMLKAVGSLELADYQEVLTKDNLMERVEFHSDDEFINQQTSQPKDYSAAIYKQLLQNLKQLSPDQALQLTQAFKVGVEDKNILISLFDEKNSEFLQKMGWSGELVFPVCPQRFPQTNCFVSKIYQVEANIGLNRINEYIDRKIEERVEFIDKKIKHTRTVVYTNKAKSDGWPLGSYKLYLRFITDKETQPREVLIDGKKLDGSLANVYVERENKVVGFPLEIPKNSTVTIKYVYETDKLVDEPLSYLLFDQKQPGIKRTDLKTIFYFPGRKPTLIAPQGNLAGDTIDFVAEENDHSFVGVSLQNK